MSKERHFFLALSFTTVLGFSAGAWAGDGIVALQTADASCADDSGNRYVDCGNGTVTDNDTGLVWLANANCLNDIFDWHTEMEFVAGLSDLPGNDPDDCGLEDGSSPGEWRLPSKAEWQAMIADASSCNPRITDDSGSGCWDEACVTGGACSFFGVMSSFYWGSTTRIAAPSWAWGMNLEFYLPDPQEELSYPKDNAARAWPVRGGQ